MHPPCGMRYSSKLRTPHSKVTNMCSARDLCCMRRESLGQSHTQTCADASQHKRHMSVHRVGEWGKLSPALRTDHTEKEWCGSTRLTLCGLPTSSPRGIPTCTRRHTAAHGSLSSQRRPGSAAASLTLTARQPANPIGKYPSSVTSHRAFTTVEKRNYESGELPR